MAVTDTSFYRPFVDKALGNNAVGILTPERLEFVARTSGTTGGTKYIAYPKTLIKAFKRFELSFALDYMRRAKNYTLLDSQILVTAGSPTCDTLPNGLTLGYATGIMTLLAPRIARDVVRPSRHILEIPSLDEKIAATVREALSLDIRLFTGIPMWAIAVLEKLLTYARECGREAPHAKALWPNLAVYYWSGASVATHERRLRELLGPGVHIQEVYSASESPIAYQHDLERPGLFVDLEDTYFEFQEVGASAEAPRIGIEEIEVGVRYRILMSTWGGLFAFRIGDVVEFLSKRPFLLAVSGRETEQLNLAGEKVSLTELRVAMKEAECGTGALVRDFFVVPTSANTSARVGYELCIEFERSPNDLGAFAGVIDEAIQRKNCIYSGVRKGHEQLLAAPVVTPLAADALKEYVRAKRAFGQSKLPQLYESRASAKDLIDYVTQFRSNEGGGGGA